MNTYSEYTEAEKKFRAIDLEKIKAETGVDYVKFTRGEVWGASGLRHGKNGKGGSSYMFPENIRPGTDLEAAFIRDIKTFYNNINL